MNKEVLISFIGSQDDGEDVEKIELFTEGKFYLKGGHYYVSYAESTLTGMEGTTTTLKVDIENKIITMMRFGSNSTHLIFQQGKKHTCCYETGYGALSVGVCAEYVNIDINENGGKLSAKYTIDINNRLMGTNDFNITIKERNNQDEC